MTKSMNKTIDDWHNETNKITSDASFLKHSIFLFTPVLLVVWHSIGEF